jgi:HNH endonuclease
MCWSNPQTTPSRDHAIPKSRGGGEGDNVIWCCHQCNQTKGQMTEQEFRKWMRIGRPNKPEYLRSLGLASNDRNIGKGPSRRLTWQETAEFLRNGGVRRP